MWTVKNRARYNRDRLRYPSDLTDEEWALIEPLIPPGKPGGGKRRVDLREVSSQAVNALVFARLACLPKKLRRPAMWAACSLAVNNLRNRRESTRTGRKKPGLQDIHLVPSIEMPPPGTIMWMWG